MVFSNGMRVWQRAELLAVLFAGKGTSRWWMVLSRPSKSTTPTSPVAGTSTWSLESSATASGAFADLDTQCPCPVL